MWLRKLRNLTELSSALRLRLPARYSFWRAKSLNLGKSYFSRVKTDNTMLFTFKSNVPSSFRSIIFPEYASRFTSVNMICSFINANLFFISRRLCVNPLWRNTLKQLMIISRSFLTVQAVQLYGAIRSETMWQECQCKKEIFPCCLR